MALSLIGFAILLAGIGAGALIGSYCTARSEAKRRIVWPVVGPVALDVADARALLDHFSEALHERDDAGIEFTPGSDALYALLERIGIDPTRVPAITGTLQWLHEYADLHQPGINVAAVALPDATPITDDPGAILPPSLDPFDRAASELEGLLLKLNHTGFDQAWVNDADRVWELLDTARDFLIQRGFRP